MDAIEFDQQRIGREVDRARGRMVRAGARSTASEADDLRWLAGRHRAYSDYLRTEARGLIHEKPPVPWFRDEGRP